MAGFEGISALHVSKKFGTSANALDDVSLQLGPRETIGVIGESGSGKSTLARLLLGLSAPTGGKVCFNGRDLRDMAGNRSMMIEFRRAVQFIAQNTTSSFDPMRTVRDSVGTPLVWLAGLTRKAADERVDQIMSKLSLPAILADRYPYELSGGQRQRFAIARAIIVEPKYLICDEVVSALDVSVQGSILNLLKDYCRSREAALIFVTHNIPAAAFIADTLVVMNHGKIVERGPRRDLIENCRHPYTAKLLLAHRSLPAPGRDSHRQAFTGEGS